MECKEKDNLFFKGSFHRRGGEEGKIYLQHVQFLTMELLKVVATENKIAAQSGSGKC